MAISCSRVKGLKIFFEQEARSDVGIPRILNQLASDISSSSRRQSREIRILGESRSTRKQQVATGQHDCNEIV
jgi:hypothetical protein